MPKLSHQHPDFQQKLIGVNIEKSSEIKLSVRMCLGDVEADAGYSQTSDLNTVENWEFGLNQETLWDLRSILISSDFCRRK